MFLGDDTIIFKVDYFRRKIDDKKLIFEDKDKKMEFCGLNYARRFFVFVNFLV